MREAAEDAAELEGAAVVMHYSMEHGPDDEIVDEENDEEEDMDGDEGDDDGEEEEEEEDEDEDDMNADEGDITCSFLSALSFVPKGIWNSETCFTIPEVGKCKCGKKWACANSIRRNTNLYNILVRAL